MQRRRFASGLAVLAALALGLVAPPGAARAEEPIKIGLLLPYSGPFAGGARQIDNGGKLYMQQHGDTVAGRKIEILRRDTTGVAPDVAKRLAQELVTRDKVDFLAGFLLTPNALAVADIATEAKVPMVIMNAATSIITTKSPYIARVSFTLPQVTEPLAQWAAKNGVKQVYIMTSDYGPGHDAEEAFDKAFTAAGGQIVGKVRMPVKSPDFAAYVQKVGDLKPQAVFLFVPSGEQPTALMKTFAEQGLTRSGLKILATGDVTDDDELPAMGDAALGIITSHHYSYAHDSQLNKAYVTAYEAAYPGIRPNFMSVGGYDGMAAIYRVIEALKGQIDADKAMAVLKGMKIDSPRGAIEIDPATRDVVQTVYIRRVEKVDGKVVNIEFDKIPNVKDPGKPN
ncbi:MAG TPA: ABC transporter substrate-binding protein [Stellaceae bacterium]|nr:ABC transporter substrate-binding protein [Stellaceae bacterium]